jgi:ribosomal protein S18 acetylase RimI-like enzyme
VAVGLRPVAPGDEGLLREIFASTRERELAILPPSVAGPFVDQQFAFQQRHLAAAYPGGAHTLILSPSGEAVGRLLVDVAGDRLYLAELAVLASHRRQGYGRAAVASVQARAAALGLPVRLHVEHDRPAAIALYEALGFDTVAEDQLRREMAWAPSA